MKSKLFKYTLLSLVLSMIFFSVYQLILGYIFRYPNCLQITVKSENSILQNIDLELTSYMKSNAYRIHVTSVDDIYGTNTKNSITIIKLRLNLLPNKRLYMFCQYKGSDTWLIEANYFLSRYSTEFAVERAQLYLNPNGHRGSNEYWTEDLRLDDDLILQTKDLLNSSRRWFFNHKY